MGDTRRRTPRSEGGFGMNIGEQRRTIYIEPIEEPMPVEAPEPASPAQEPESEPEREPV
jgi:hypothetical protein